ncbi:MAG: transcription antitermination factor NusB [Myxococcota bacterium]|nr:transcription antitermination factor NusB [Myxococcota bacterium]
MASRSRARAFAVQLLYGADARTEAYATSLLQLERTLLEDDPIANLSAPQRAYLDQVSYLDDSSLSTFRAKKVFDYHRATLKESSFQLWDSQLELPEAWHLRSQLVVKMAESSNRITSKPTVGVKHSGKPKEQIKEFDRLLSLGVDASDAYQLVLHPKKSQFFEHALRHAQTVLAEEEEYFSPKVIAHWIVNEPHFYSLLDLDIDVEALFECLCLIQQGYVSESAGRELLKLVRTEYAPGRSTTDLSISLIAKNAKLWSPQRKINALEREVTTEMIKEMRPAEPAEIEYTDGLIAGILEHLSDIDRRIQRASSSWKLERMSLVDRNIVRLGSFELLHRPSVPSRVIINEAILLSRKFSDTGYIVQKDVHEAVWRRSKGAVTHDSAKFVNGVLDKIARESGRDDLVKARK